MKKEILLFARLYRAVHRWRWALSDVEIKAIAKANEIGIWPSQPSKGVFGQQRYHWKRHKTAVLGKEKAKMWVQF